MFNWYKKEYPLIGLAGLGGGIIRSAKKQAGAVYTTEQLRVLGTAIGTMTQNGGLSSAFDGSTSGDYTQGARKDPSAGCWIGKNFGEVVRISSITIYRPDGSGGANSGSNCFPGEGGGNYYFQYSSDGTNWTTISTVSGTTNKSLTTSFTATNAQYWRVLFDGDNNGGTVQEMQFSS